MKNSLELDYPKDKLKNYMGDRWIWRWNTWFITNQIQHGAPPAGTKR
jgi:hypothetical protein